MASQISSGTLEASLLLIHGIEEIECLQKEMTGAYARIEKGNFLERFCLGGTDRHRGRSIPRLHRGASQDAWPSRGRPGNSGRET